MLMLLPQILSHWACAKVDASGDVSDEELQEALTGKLRGQPGVQWATIARHAQAKGRRPLAALLLEHESSAAEQVNPRRSLHEPSDTCFVLLVIVSGQGTPSQLSS